jgi:hypothetical protein
MGDSGQNRGPESLASSVGPWVLAGLDWIAFIVVLARLITVPGRLRSLRPAYDLSTCMTFAYLGLCISYLFSGYGFLRWKKWAFVLYYFQFPLRIAFCTGSFAFLSPMNALLGSPVPVYTIGSTILVGERARLIVTIIIHKRHYTREHSH